MFTKRDEGNGGDSDQRVELFNLRRISSGNLKYTMMTTGHNIVLYT